MIDLGVPGAALMEVASKAVAEVARSFGRSSIVVVCGSGNNGGDGYACARWLHGWGLPVRLWSLSAASTGDAAIMRAVCERLQIPDRPGLDGAALIVDAIFGTGLSRPVQDPEAAAIGQIRASGLPVVAIDIPSGVHAETGAELGCAVKAAATVTFGYPKPGLYGEPGADLVGALHVVDIGLGAAGLGSPFAEVPEAADLRPLWPIRSAGDHKNRSGHLLVVAGSAEMTGAAILCCRGALAAGVGLISLVTPANPRLAELPPEVMLQSEIDLTNRSALVAGPGLGSPNPALADLWRTAPIPILFDADALKLPLSAHVHGPRVITPHPGEAARRLNTTNAAIQADRFGAARALAHGTVALLKGRNTLVAADAHPISINPSGNAILATGGSGDVLSGLIGALLARGLPARDAARVGAYIHGRSADLLLQRRPEGWTASDIAAAIPDAVAELLG